jgi:hypothetical protein
VANLNSFRFDKYLGNIIQKSIRILPISRVSPLSITIDNSMVQNIMKDPLAITLTGVDFTQASKQNLKNMMQEIKEYKERIQDPRRRSTILQG